MLKKLLINSVIVVGAVGAGVYMSLRPWQVYQQQSKEARRHTIEMHKAEDHRDDLLRKEARAHSDIGKEELAREKGYLGPDEVAADPDKK